VGLAVTASCIALVSGLGLVVLPTPVLTLSWTHTVEKTVWEEDYSASADRVTITEARIEAFGAGMEPPASAVRDGRWWRYRPALAALSSVDLANSAFAGGYTLCWNSTCRPLASIVAQGEPVSIVSSACTEAVAPSPAKAQ
jgi:hypothetical protein